MRFIEITPANRHWVSRISAGKAARSWVYRNSYWERNAAEHPEIALRLIMVDEHRDPVGIIAFGQHFADEDLSVPRPGVGEIIHLVIDERQQDRGYGRQAVQLAISQLQENYDRIVIAHDPDNAVARGLYESLGFRQFTENYDGDPLLELITKRSGGVR